MKEEVGGGDDSKHMRPRIYIDTSVIGGYFDDKFEAASKSFFQRIENGDFEIYFSEVHETELPLAPKHIQELKERIPSSCYNYPRLTDDVKLLAEKYVAERALGNSSMNDAYGHL